MTRTVVQSTCRTDDMIHAMVPTNCLRLICRQRRGRTSSLETKRMKASGNSNSVSSLRPSVAGFLLPTYCCTAPPPPRTLSHTRPRRRLRSTSHSHHPSLPLSAAPSCALTSLASTRRLHISAHQFSRRPADRPCDRQPAHSLPRASLLSSRSPPPLPPQPPRSLTYTPSPPA